MRRLPYGATFDKYKELGGEAIADEKTFIEIASEEWDYIDGLINAGVLKCARKSAEALCELVDVGYKERLIEAGNMDAITSESIGSYSVTMDRDARNAAVQKALLKCSKLRYTIICRYFHTMGVLK